MSKQFNELEIKILTNVALFVDEQYVESRKNDAQESYVFEVKKDATWPNIKSEELGGKLVPENLKGFWMMEYPTSLRYLTLEDAIRYCRWVRCELKEVTETKYVEINDYA